MARLVSGQQKRAEETIDSRPLTGSNDGAKSGDYVGHRDGGGPKEVSRG